jgi:hypothetical protein
MPGPFPVETARLLEVSSCVARGRAGAAALRDLGFARCLYRPARAETDGGHDRSSHAAILGAFDEAIIAAHTAAPARQPALAAE